MSNYKLTTHGELLDGYSIDDVKQKVASLFKLDQNSDKFKALFSGKEITIKKGLDKTQGEKYCKALQNTGLNCALIDESLSPVTVDIPEVSTPVTPTPATENTAASESFDPYQQPKSDLTVQHEQGDYELEDPKKLTAGAGLGWLKEGYYYFKMCPLVWIVTIVIYMAIMMASSFVPFLSILTNIFMPVFVGGFMLACYQLYNNEEFKIGDLFAGFKNNFGGLAMVGGLFLLGSIVALVVGVTIMFMFLGTLDFTESTLNVNEQGFPLPILLAGLLALLIYTLLLMAYWFAPALVILHDLSAVQAMRLSFQACLKNFVPLLIYGILLMVLFVIASIPVFLGLLILLPIATASVFASYRQIFTNSEDVL